MPRSVGDSRPRSRGEASYRGASTAPPAHGRTEPRGTGKAVEMIRSRGATHHCPRLHDPLSHSDRTTASLIGRPLPRDPRLIHTTCCFSDSPENKKRGESHET